MALRGENFLFENLEAVVRGCGNYLVVKSIEYDPEFSQQESCSVHAEYGIITETWSSLNRGTVFDVEPIVATIKAHDVSSASPVLV